MSTLAMAQQSGRSRSAMALEAPSGTLLIQVRKCSLSRWTDRAICISVSARPSERLLSAQERWAKCWVGALKDSMAMAVLRHRPKWRESPALRRTNLGGYGSSIRKTYVYAK